MAQSTKTCDCGHSIRNHRLKHKKGRSKKNPGVRVRVECELCDCKSFKEKVVVPIGSCDCGKMEGCEKCNPKPATPAEGANEIPKECRDCKRQIEWINVPKTGYVPVDAKVTVIVTPEGRVISGFVPHYFTCPETEKFRQTNGGNNTKPRPTTQSSKGGAETGTGGA